MRSSVSVIPVRIHSEELHTDIERKFFIPVHSMYNGDGLATSVLYGQPALVFPDAAEHYVETCFMCPVEKVLNSLLYAKPVWACPTAGNARLKEDLHFGSYHEDVNHISHVGAYGTFACLADKLEISSYSINETWTMQAYDCVYVKFYRDGADVLDTLGDNLYLFGLWCYYTAKQ